MRHSISSIHSRYSVSLLRRTGISLLLPLRTQGNTYSPLLCPRNDLLGIHISFYPLCLRIYICGVLNNGEILYASHIRRRLMLELSSVSSPLRHQQPYHLWQYPHFRRGLLAVFRTYSPNKFQQDSSQFIIRLFLCLLFGGLGIKQHPPSLDFLQYLHRLLPHTTCLYAGGLIFCITLYVSGSSAFSFTL